MVQPLFNSEELFFMQKNALIVCRFARMSIIFCERAWPCVCVQIGIVEHDCRVFAIVLQFEKKKKKKIGI